jgi:hypothetical protein
MKQVRAAQKLYFGVVREVGEVFDVPDDFESDIVVPVDVEDVEIDEVVDDTVVKHLVRRPKTKPAEPVI